MLAKRIEILTFHRTGGCGGRGGVEETHLLCTDNLKKKWKIPGKYWEIFTC